MRRSLNANHVKKDHLLVAAWQLVNGINQYIICIYEYSYSDQKIQIHMYIIYNTLYIGISRSSVEDK